MDFDRQTLLDEAGLAGKIDLRIWPAAATLEQLTREFGKNSFDFAFIHAEKAAYDLYYERCLELVRRGGVIVLDNVLWRGDVECPSLLHPMNWSVKRR